MRKNLILMTLVISVMLISLVSAGWFGITGGVTSGSENKVLKSSNYNFEDWTDSDEDNPSDEAGITVYETRTQWKWRADYCVNDNKLKEYYLRDGLRGKKVVSSRTIFCRYGCEDVSVTFDHEGFAESITTQDTGQCASPPEAESCAETDAGVTVTYSDESTDSYTDRCVGSTAITYTCDSETNEQVKADKNCGRNNCVSGTGGVRCREVSGGGLSTVSACTDSDDSDNTADLLTNITEREHQLIAKGTVSKTIEGKTYSLTDECIGPSTVLEYWCSSSGNAIGAMGFACPTGKVCSRGACVTA